eukprot:gene16911-22400_t
MDVNALSALLEESKVHEETRISSHQPPISSGGVKIILPNQKNNNNTSKQDKIIVDNKNIWNIDELPTEDTIVCDINDGRPNPRYEFSYKQIIGAEDVFLGMSDISPSSSDCTHLVIKIHFPNSSMKELDVDLTKRRIKAESRTHRLFTYLPVTVDDSSGEAKYDSTKEVLTIVVPIIHDSI